LFTTLIRKNDKDMVKALVLDTNEKFEKAATLLSQLKIIRGDRAGHRTGA